LELVRIHVVDELLLDLVDVLAGDEYIVGTTTFFSTASRRVRPRPPSGLASHEDRLLHGGGGELPFLDRLDRFRAAVEADVDELAPLARVSIAGMARGSPRRVR
jgi:hypothetical protein